MTQFLRIVIVTLIALPLAGASLFQDRFNGNALGARWTSEGGSFTVADHALTIRSEKSNPIIRMLTNDWKNYRVTFTLTRRGYSQFDVYVGMRYPVYLKLTLEPPHQGKLRLAANRVTGKSEPLTNVDYAKRIDAAAPLRFDISAIGDTLSCSVNGIEMFMVKDQPISGGIALGGGWNSDFEIRDLSVEQLAAPAKTEPSVADKWKRPVIKNGTFYQNGRPVFMLGVNDTCNFWEFNAVNTKPPFESNDIFTDMMSREISAKLGFNTDHVPTYARHVANDSLDELQLTPAQADQLLGSPYRDHWNERARFRSRIAGLPLVVDYSFLHLFTMDNLSKRIASAGQPADMRHDGGFMPYVPETELGRNIYNTYFRDGARWWLDHGNSNPWVYELFNEVQWYHSKHTANKQLFAEWLRKKYSGDVSAMQRAWNDTSIRSFSDVEALSPWSGGGMKADWMQFLGDRFVEIFNEGKAAIRSVDPRSDVYFDIEIAVASLWYEQNGIDYHKLMKSADIFGTEGGMPFGTFVRPKQVGYLDEVMNAKPVEVMFYYDLARAFAGDKPVMNQESYVRRTHGELGVVPTQRADFSTLLWFEVFHNYSGSQVYCWWKGGRDFGWKTAEDARATTKKNPPALLNPYAYPLESLKGFKDFSAEIDRLAEIALPYPRTVQDIGILYSIPSVWRQPHSVSHTQKFDYQQNCFNWYSAFNSRQLPVGVITEQELVERGPGRFKVIAVPYAAYSFPETAAALRAFADNGGLVIIGEGSLRFDPYGKGQNSSGLSGRNIAVISDKLSRQDQPQELIKRLQELGYRRPWRMKIDDGEALPELEIQAIRRENIDLYFFCNWNGRRAASGIFYPAGRKDSTVYVTDMVKMIPVSSPSGKLAWSTAEIADGIPVALPSQERVLLAVSSEKQHYTTDTALTAGAIRERAALSAQALAERLAPLDRELEAMQDSVEKAARDARAPYPADTAKCVPLDIAKAVNMGFRDETSGDKKGGWTDQGSMDFREFPVGRQVFAGVPFQIIDAEKNEEKSCIVLSGAIKYFSAESPEIPVGSGVRNMYVLHAAAWGGQSGKQFEYVITYADGSVARFPINGAAECADWVGNNPVSNGRIVAETTKPNGMKIGAYVTCWSNTAPDKKVTSVKVVSAQAEAVPIVIGITVER
ncbi:MAG: beta-galactosidase trimerization domain-containing protein [Spirochaetes bacterium]|nr:beta-galactosidase trimerization domain-containing protein [Spirochaetota bacterium]